MRRLVLIVALVVAPAALPSADAGPRRGDRGLAALAVADGGVDTVELIRGGVDRLLPPELAVASVTRPASLPAAIDPAAVTVEYPRAARAGAGVAQVTVRDGERARTLWVRLVLGRRGPIAIARRDLAPGVTVTAADLEIVEGASSERDPIDPAGLIGLQLARPVAAGAALAAADVVVPAALPRSTSVTIVVRRGGVAVRAGGRLERPARLGELAAARLIARGGAAGHVVTGRLGPGNTVVVEEVR